MCDLVHGIREHLDPVLEWSLQMELMVYCQALENDDIAELCQMLGKANKQERKSAF